MSTSDPGELGIRVDPLEIESPLLSTDEAVYTGTRTNGNLSTPIHLRSSTKDLSKSEVVPGATPYSPSFEYQSKQGSSELDPRSWTLNSTRTPQTMNSTRSWSALGSLSVGKQFKNLLPRHFRQALKRKDVCDKDDLEHEADIEIDHLKQQMRLKSRQMSRMTMFLSFIALGLIATFFVFNLREIIIFSIADGAWWRLVFVLVSPIWMTYLIFPLSYSLKGIMMIFGPIDYMTTNTQYFSAKPVSRPENQAGESAGNEHASLPKVTIQVPVFKENLEKVLIPTLRSLKTACKAYTDAGGEVNIFVNDDGLQVLTDEKEKLKRISYYSKEGISYVARPAIDRAGLFKKASNMNYCLNIALEVEKRISRLGMQPLAAIEDVWKACDREFVGGGDVSLGKYILLVDSDTRVPPDCLIKTIPEFVEFSDLAYTQHRTRAFCGDSLYPMNYWESMISHFTNDIYDIGIAMSVASGDICPLVGHNCILRKSALLEVAQTDPQNGYVRVWSERHVSEDFDLAIRLHNRGFHGRYVTYTGSEFLEGVSLSYSDEVVRLRKYAYGACEIMLNKLTDWPSKGLFSPVLKNFLSSQTTPWYSKVHIIGYLCNYFALSSMWILAWTSFCIWSFVPSLREQIDKPFDIIITSICIFTGIGLLANVAVKYRLKLSPDSIMDCFIKEVQQVIPMTIFWNGISWYLFTAMLSFLVNSKVEWGATSKERKATSNTCVEIQQVFKEFKWMYLSMALQGTLFIALILTFSVDLQAQNLVPLSLAITGHCLAPLLLNPIVMRFRF